MTTKSKDRVVDALACVIVKLFFDLALTYIPPAANSLAAALVVGINKITLSGPVLKFATTVEVALFVRVTLAVAFRFPLKILLTTSLVSR
tara:strand:- start:1847 stop:2116 length:270 start_codon:yes stop_codon:yes gene_type:complete